MIPWQPWGGLGSGTWPHRQVLLPKSRYYFLGMKKKVKKKFRSHGFVLPPSKKKKADATAVLQWEVTLPHSPQPPLRALSTPAGGAAGTSSWKRFGVCAGRLLEVV